MRDFDYYADTRGGYGPLLLGKGVISLGSVNVSMCLHVISSVKEGSISWIFNKPSRLLLPREFL